MVLLIIFSFDEEISHDVKDGTLHWLFSQNISASYYLWSKVLAFSSIVFCVCIVIFALNGFIKAISLFLICTQSVLLVAYLSLIRHMHHVSLGEITLTFLIFPLCIPSFLLISEIWQQEIPWWNGLLILNGLTLLSVVFGTVAFEKTKTLSV